MRLSGQGTCGCRAPILTRGLGPGQIAALELDSTILASQIELSNLPWVPHLSSTANAAKCTSQEMMALGSHIRKLASFQDLFGALRVQHTERQREWLKCPGLRKTRTLIPLESTLYREA